MKIAYLGWGSLKWEPKCLALERTDDNRPVWHADGPSLPVEFTRESSKFRITLVIVPENERPTQPRVPVLWAYSTLTTIEAARENLRCREGAKNIQSIGVWPSKDNEPFEFSDLIEEWAKSKNLDGVVWTALKPKFGNIAKVPSSSEVLEYLKKLCSEKKEDAAREYVCKAPPQIRTPYRTDIEQNFGWNHDDSTE